MWLTRSYFLQQTAIGLLIKVRPEQDPNKAEEFEKAVKDLALAHRTFSHLRHQNMKGVRTGLEDAKLDQHIGFCMEMHTEASKDLQKASHVPILVNGVESPFTSPLWLPYVIMPVLVISKIKF